MFKADLHIHSNSHKRLACCPLLYDSVQSVPEILARALATGLTILAITDHDSLEGSVKAGQIVESQGLPLMLIPGCEVSSADGHILAYQISREIPKGRPARETVDRIHDQGGYAFAAHPFFIHGLGDLIYDLPLDGLEGFNATSSHMANLKARAAADQLGLPILANSDAHQPEEIGRSHMRFATAPPAGSEFFTLLQQGDYQIHCAATPSLPWLWRHLTRNVRLQLGGESIPVPTPATPALESLGDSPS